MKKMILASALAAIGSGAFAQTSHFTGLSGALNLSAVAMSNRLSDDETVFDALSHQSWNGSVQAAYGFAVSPNAVVSVGGGYVLGSSKAGKFTNPDGTLSLKLKNQISLHVEPGWLVSEKTLAYGKVSYERAKSTVSATGETDESRSVKGTGIGFGVRTMLDKTSFIQVEVRQVGYKSVDLVDGPAMKPKATLGSIGFGMKF